MTAARTAQDINLKPRTGDVLIEENLEFRGLLLSPLIQEGLSKCGFVRPSPIQLKAIPLGRCGLDLIVQAKSGTGKTCVFSVIALEGILLDSMATQVLVLAPTREIAVQICEVVNNMGSCMPGLRCLTFIGGTPLNEDRKKLARCHIAIGTPGRIKQLIEEKLLNTSNIRLFVLDEADKLLEDSFQEQVNWIFSSLPENKQMLALSATYPEVLAQQLTAYMRNPTFLRLNITDPALLGIRQYYRTVKFNPLANKLFDSKTEALLELLSSVEFHQCLVFSNYQMRAESLSEVLNYRGWPTTYISGSREQQDRMAAMTSLKQMTCRVLISTDLTSRGIDAENVNLVVNLDLPPNHETYLHRIGRAGRFGTYGAGVSFVAEGEEMDGMHNIEKHCKTTIKPLPDPIPDDLARSSGFVCLEHLVTTETIITKKEEVNASQSKPIIASPPKPQPEAKVPNGDGPSASESNRILPEESELTDVNGNRSCEPESVDTCEEPLISGPVSGSGDPPSEVAQQSESTKIAPRRKTNNVWTNLSYSYRAESKDMEEKRGKGQLVSASANDQRRNTSPRKAASAVKHGEDKENSRNVANVVADNERIAVSDNISADEQVLLKDGDASILAATGNSVTTLPSVRGTEGCPAGHRTYTELLADYDKYIARDVCESVDPTLAVDVKTVINIKYEDYLKNISKLLQNLVEHKLQPAQLKKTEDIVPSASSKLSSVPSVPGKQLEDPPVVCATQKSKCPQIKDVKLTETPVKCAHKKLDTKKTSNDGACGKQLTSEQLMMNYAALNDNHRRPQPDAEEQNVDLGAVVIGVNLSQFTAKTTKPKMAKPKKKVSPYGPWEPYVPPTKPEVEEDEEESYEQEVDGEEFESGESDADSDWESSSLDDVGAGQGTHANHSPRRSSGKGTSRNYGQYPPYSIEQGHYPTQKEGQERDSAQSWEQAHYASYPGEQEHYPQYAKDQWHYPQPQEQPGSYPGHSGYAYYPPQPGHAYYPQQSGHGYYPPPSGYGDHCPPPWGVPSPPDLAFQNMMHAQQAMLFTTTCYHQYVMHLQQAEFYKWMLQSQHAQSNTGSLYRAQERYIRKLAKWMAKNNHK